MSSPSTLAAAWSSQSSCSAGAATSASHAAQLRRPGSRDSAGRRRPPGPTGSVDVRVRRYAAWPAPAAATRPPSSAQPVCALRAKPQHACARGGGGSARLGARRGGGTSGDTRGCSAMRWLCMPLRQAPHAPPRRLQCCAPPGPGHTGRPAPGCAPAAASHAAQPPLAAGARRSGRPPLGPPRRPPAAAARRHLRAAAAAPLAREWHRAWLECRTRAAAGAGVRVDHALLPRWASCRALVSGGGPQNRWSGQVVCFESQPQQLRLRRMGPRGGG